MRGAAMIHDYSDHAANERTFLAWVRTGIAVIAFGFVIEKFNLFLREIAVTAQGKIPMRPPGIVGHYEGLALIFGGVGLIVLASVRFVRITRYLDDAQTHAAQDVRTEMILSAVLVVLVASYSLYLAFN
jgi:putative membrane protein